MMTTKKETIEELRKRVAELEEKIKKEKIKESYQRNYNWEKEQNQRSRWGIYG